MKHLYLKHFNSLRPADETALEALSRIKHGKLVTVEIRQSRNLQHHRLYWALVNLVWKNLDHDRYPTADDLHGALKISAGHRVRINLPGGREAFMPKSISFDKMSQEDFAAFYNRVCDLIALHFWPTVTSADLKAEVASMIGIAPFEAPPRDTHENLRRGA